jgi:Protein of unknown function (DUF1566)
MLKTSQTTLACLLALLPVIGAAQPPCQKAIVATTPTIRFTTNNNGTVYDKYTGLMWKKCSEGQQWKVSNKTCTAVAGNYSWQQALQLTQKLNVKGFAGYKDWRVPNIKELHMLVERQCYSPAVNLGVFPNTSGTAVDWSTTPLIGDGYIAWYVDLSDGRDGATLKGRRYQVRLVRGGQ